MRYESGRLIHNIRGQFFEETVAHLFGASGYTVERTGFEYRESLLAKKYGKNIPQYERYRPDFFIRQPNQDRGFSVEVKACLRHKLSDSRNPAIMPLATLRKQKGYWHGGNLPEIHPVYVVLVETAWAKERIRQKWPTFCVVAPEKLIEFLSDGRTGLTELVDTFKDRDVFFEKDVLQECRIQVNIHVRLRLIWQAVTKSSSDVERLKKLDKTAKLMVEASKY